MLDPELFELIPKIDLSTPEKVVAFKMWQFNDGTVEGLRKLYEAQQSVQSDVGLDVCPNCHHILNWDYCRKCGEVLERPRR